MAHPSRILGCRRLLASPVVVPTQPSARRRPDRPARSIARPRSPESWWRRRRSPVADGERLSAALGVLLLLRSATPMPEISTWPDSSAWPRSAALRAQQQQPGAERPGGRGGSRAGEASLAWLAWNACATELVRRDNLKARPGPPQQAELQQRTQSTSAPRSPGGSAGSRRSRATSAQRQQRLPPARGPAAMTAVPYMTLQVLAIAGGSRHQRAPGVRRRGVLVRALRAAEGPGRRGRAVTLTSVTLVHGGMDPPALEHVRPLPHQPID